MVRAVVDIESYATLALEMDLADPLRAFREAFTGLDGKLIYLDGNSLGPLPKATSKLLQSTVQEAWGEKLIQSWNEEWYDLPERMGNLLAPLIGAQDGEVCFADSVTINLFKLAAAALKRQSGRKTILTDDLNFPSDYYALDGLIGMLGRQHRMHRVESEDGMTIPTEQLIAAINEDTALVTLSHVVFKSGFKHDLEAICRAAHAKGAMVLADISHSVGSVPIHLGDWGVDMAIGCSYKYLNGGPGAPAFLFVKESLQDDLEPQLAGWFGADDPFAFKSGFAPSAGIRRFLVGTPPILSLQAVEPGIQLLRDAGMAAIRDKSIRQSECLIELFDEFLEPIGFELGSPRDIHQRGSHIALRHPEAFRINKAMIHPKEGKLAVIPDFRTPDNLRLGITPLFLSHLDVGNAPAGIIEIVVNHEYKSFSHEAGTVT
jgi:kynureninase